MVLYIDCNSQSKKLIKIEYPTIQDNFPKERSSIMTAKKISKKFFSSLVFFSMAAMPLMNLQAAALTPKGSNIAINDKVTFEGAFHHLQKISPADHQVSFDDGSGWSVKESDGKSLENWHEGDKVIVSQTTDTLGSLRYKYKLTNLDSAADNEVAINLQIPPSDKEKMRCITSIDTAKHEMVLSDNSTWKVSASDGGTLHFLGKNARIVIGANAGSDNNEFPYILIDCDRNIYVRASEA